jgi:hypothetical protein
MRHCPVELADHAVELPSPTVTRTTIAPLLLGILEAHKFYENPDCVLRSRCRCDWLGGYCMRLREGRLHRWRGLYLPLLLVSYICADNGHGKGKDAFIFGTTKRSSYGPPSCAPRSLVATNLV